MKRLYRVVLLLAAGLAYSAFAAESVEMGITTGRQTGTYFQFGKDLGRMLGEHGFELVVYTSRGSLENVATVSDRRSVPLGIAQADVLTFLNMSDDPKTKRIAEVIRLLLPLYAEEVHLLAGKDIKALADLAGKRVAIGAAGSGTAVTATVVLAVSGVTPKEALEINTTRALEALRKGEVDAMFFVAGQPVALLRDEVTANDNLHLVAITNQTVQELYQLPAVIPAAAYAWQDTDVKTVGVSAGLMTYDFPRDSENCARIGRVAQLVRDNLEWLRENGHEKWGEVNLDAPVAESIRSSCLAAAQ
jgi:TRAP transporter TAXI family solute receptor